MSECPVGYETCTVTVLKTLQSFVLWGLNMSFFQMLMRKLILIVCVLTFFFNIESAPTANI